ncbi:hypothetical protein BDM02DRAFT_3262386 [Thelephora ganbajun]|uniref:Uncharacterized protein n=1 Tax=Thelephora ganbajun TaxID=370292 RepID=A0ACB6Z9S1_THEGA|nr:hypothetical protein BDM02DRAFT_3262386 [Thelephora ganbajun]
MYELVSGPIMGLPGVLQYAIRTNLGLDSTSPRIYISHVFSYVAPPFTILYHSMASPIRTQFSITHWFGKQFPSNCFQYPDLELYCDRLRTIPPQCPVNYNLNTHLPIHDFLCSTFPSHTPSLVVEAASQCFSDNPPTEILASLVERDIPPRKFIQDLKSKFGQAVLDHRRSIRDPLYDRSFLPLWVLTLWEQLAELNAVRKEWMLA